MEFGDHLILSTTCADLGFHDSVLLNAQSVAVCRETFGRFRPLMSPESQPLLDASAPQGNLAIDKQVRMFPMRGSRRMRKVADRWLTSVEVRKVLRISTCDLAHLRAQGAIRFAKKGNAYLYSSIDIACWRRGTPGLRRNLARLMVPTEPVRLSGLRC